LISTTRPWDHASRVGDRGQGEERANTMIRGRVSIPAVASVALVALLSTGCITFNGKELPRPAVSKRNEPSAVVAVVVGDLNKTFNGKDNDLGAFNEGLAARTTATQITRYWKLKGLIKDFGFPGDLDAPPDYRLTVGGTIDESGSITGAVLTGLTLYTLPSISRMTYDLDLQLDRLEGDEVLASYETTAKNSYSLWQWIVFVPTTIFGSLVWGSYSSNGDRSLYIYEQFRKQGAFDPIPSVPTPPPAAPESAPAPEPAPPAGDASP
jgi:hypothetical protein